MDNDITGYSFIRTKLHRPSLPGDYIHRPQLTRQLERFGKPPLILVSAPAGYGKSTLVSSWMESCDFANAWISLDEHDNDLLQFLNYFVNAFQGMFPNSLPKSCSLLDASTLPPVHVLAGSLINEMDMIEDDFFLVIDDFHLIKEMRVHDLLAELLRYPPKRMHLVIIGRSDPFLPTVQFRAQQKIVEFRIHDLRFTQQETKEFLQTTQKNTIDDATASAWTEKTEGWITGLRLAALSMLNRNDLNSLLLELQGREQNIMKYLFDEVLANQPEHVRSHLLALSIVDRFCAPLCEVLCPYPENECELDGWNVIRWINKNNLFCIPLDNEGYWFRFHHLFKELLRRQLVRRQSPEEIDGLNSRASEWFESQGIIMDSINHALAAGNVEGAADIFERHRRAEQDADRWRVMERWLGMFSAEIQQQRPGLLLAKAWIFHDRYELMRIPSIVKQLESLLDDNTTEQVSLGELHFFKGVLLFWQGQGEASLKHLIKAQQLIPQVHPRMTGLVEIYLGLGRQMIGQKDIALLEIIEKCRSDISLTGEYLSRLFLAQALIHIIAGKLASAADAAQRVKKLSKKINIVYMHGWGQYIQASCHFRSNNLEAASRIFSQVIEKRYVTHTKIVIDSLVGLALVYQSMQRPDAAMETLQQLVDFAQETEDPAHLSVAHSALARLSLAQGDLNSASRWMRSLNQVPPVPTFFIWLENPSITQVRVWLSIASDESLRKAIELIQAQRQELESLHNTCQIIEIMVLQSLTLVKLGRNDEALSVMKEALELAGPEGLVRPFVESGTDMTEILIQLKEQNVFTDFIDNLLKAIQAEEQMKISPPLGAQAEQELSASLKSLAVPLTEREIEVLMLLNQRFSRKEIAEKLFISIETVKSHLKSIYQKLDVTSRREAIAKIQNPAS